MMRQTKLVEITDNKSRDFGKKYLITEMPAEQAEWWAFRVLQALMMTSVDVGSLQTPLADLAAKGLKALAGVPPEQAKPLLDEMIGCVQMSIPAGAARKLMDGDIEDVKTRFTLRKAVLELHMGFSIGGDE